MTASSDRARAGSALSGLAIAAAAIGVTSLLRFGWPGDLAALSAFVLLPAVTTWRAQHRGRREPRAV
ncbi:hypothetical protein J4558_16390 [Leptolyngbya sp. 15MV]|nr:hypothetical protein J4558_16390 [Leptolyngbya sp. 15MV]